MSSSLDRHQQGHSSIVPKQRDLSLKRVSASNQLRRRVSASSNCVHKHRPNPSFPSLHIDTSDSISALSYCGTTLLSYLSSPHPTSEKFNCQTNDPSSSPNLIGTIKQDFYTLQDYWIGRPLESVWLRPPWIPRTQQIARRTCDLVRHCIRSFNSTTEDLPNIPVLSLYSRLNFQTRNRALLLSSPIRMINSGESSSSTEARVSLVDRLCATNNNGLPSADLDPTASVPIKPRCQRIRSAIGSITSNPTGSKTQLATKSQKPLLPHIMINESHSVTEDLYDMEDETSGSLNPDEPSYNGPMVFTRFQTRSLKPPASPRRPVANSHRPAHNRSRSSSRNGLRFERIVESDASRTPTSVDDSGSAAPLNTPKPRKRYQSTTHLDRGTDQMRGDDGPMHEAEARRVRIESKSEQSNQPTRSSDSDSGKQNVELVPRPAQRSRGCALQLAVGGCAAAAKDCHTVRGFRVQQTISTFERVAMTHKVVTHTPLRCAWMVLEVYVIKHWIEPWTYLTLFVEPCRNSCHSRYSASSVFRFCLLQSSNVQFHTSFSIKSDELMNSVLSCLKEEETDCIELDQQPSVPRKFGTTGMTTENGDCDYVNETNDSTKASFWATIPTNNGTGDASDYCRDKRNPCRALEPRDRTDAHANGVGGPIGLDLIEQLRGARNLVQRKLDELSPQVPDEPELMAASCDQLRTFLGQLEAYNFRIAAARTRNAPGPRQMGDTGLGPDELESLWDCVVRLTEAWITALQQAFIQSKGLKQVLTEFRRDLTFVEARLQPFFLSSVRKRLSARRTDSCWRDVTDEIGFTEEDDEDDEELGQLVRTRSYGSGDQTTAEVSHVPTALRLLRVIRFRLSSWFSHVNLLLLTTESTRVLSSITRIQAGRPVQSRFVVDEPTRHELKRLRTSVGRLVDEAERLLTAWSTRSSPGHAGRLTSSRAFSISGSNGGASLGSGTFLSAGTNMNSPGSGYLDSGHRMRFKDQDSFFSSDTDDNVEELVSVTSQSSTSLVSDGSDELVNCEQGVDTSWASEVTAHSLAPSDTTSCGLTATLSTRSSRSTRALAQQQQQLQQQRQVEQPPELSTELHQIDAQAPRHSSLGPVDPNHDGPRTSANTPCDTEPTSSTLTFNGHRVDPESPSVSHNLPSVQLSASSSSSPPPIMAIDMPHSSKPDRPDWSWLSRRFQLPVFWNRLEQWSRLVQATFTQNEANVQPSSICPSFQAAQDNHISSQPLHEPTIPNPVPQSPLSDTKLWPNLTHTRDPTSRTIHSYWASHRRRFWPPWSRRPRFCDFLIGVLFALVLLISFPYLFHIVFSLPYFQSTVDVDRQSSCVYHWFQLPWSQDTQEAGPGHTLAKTWPHNAPPF